MEYLLFLQQLRGSAGTFVNEGIRFISEFMGGSGALALMALIYWCICRQAGSFLLLNFSGAYMTNQTLKNIFRVSRPFILDTRIQPYVSATGYSFPSGHTMLGTAVYTGMAVYVKRAWFRALCVILTLLTAFGRNWLGVHTPQDVLVGMAVSCAVVAFNHHALRWVDKKEGRDILLLALGAAWSLAVMLLIPGSGKVCGIYLGVLTGWFIERRFIGFRVDGTLPRRMIRYICGMIVVLAFHKGILPVMVKPLGAALAPLVQNFVTFLLVTAGWPAVIAFARKKTTGQK